MSLFKILHGDEERISTDITPFHESWCYVTHNGRFFVDMNIGTPEAPNYQRVEVTKLSTLDIDTIIEAMKTKLPIAEEQSV
jgi:hypothetical protein